MKLTKEQLDTIMYDWMNYAEFMCVSTGSQVAYIQERAFVFGAISALLKCAPSQIKLNDLPPIVGMCYSSGRPLSSVGTWNRISDLAGASHTGGSR